MGIGVHWACPELREYIDSNAVGDNEKHPVEIATPAMYQRHRYGVWSGRGVQLFWDTGDLPWEVEVGWKDVSAEALLELREAEEMP